MIKNSLLALLIIPAAIVSASLVNTTRSPAADLSERYAWKPVRIGAGGWMRGMAVDPQHPAVRYARGDVDNLYRWDDVRKEWIPTKIAAAFPASIAAAPVQAGCGAIAIDPLNPKVVLCAYTFNRSADISSQYPSLGLNVYRSADGGRTFTAGSLSLKGSLENETFGERLAIDPNNDKIAYFGSPQDGLWRSQDGGKTWARVAIDLGGDGKTPLADARLPRFDAGGGKVNAFGMSVSRRIYLTTGPGSVLMSDDGGIQWRDIGAGAGIDRHPGFATVDRDGNLWVAEDGSSRIWRRSRAGEWKSVETHRGGVGGIAVDPKNAKRIFVNGWGGALSRSTDGGETWTDFGSGLKFSETQPIQWLRPSAIRPQGHGISDGGIYIDTNGTLWVPGANDGILAAHTNDAVDTAASPPVWSSFSQGIEEMVGMEIALPPGGKPILTVEDETLFTIDDPDKFTAKHFGVNLWDNNNGLSSSQDIAYCPNAPRFLAVTTDNFFAGNPQAATAHYSSYSTDGGDTWTPFPSITNGSHPCVLYDGLIAISALPEADRANPQEHANLVWVPTNKYSMNSPAPFYTRDGGKTWTQTHSFDGAPGASVFDACGQKYQLMGWQWGSWIAALQQHNLVADPKTPGTFYLHLAAGGFWRSTDGGETWTQTKGSGQVAGFAHHGRLAANPFRSGDLWFVDGYEGATEHGLWRSLDGGDSFKKLTGFEHCWALTLGKSARPGAYPAVYIYGKRSGNNRWGIFRSVDEGVSWDQISGYPMGLLDVPAGMAASWDRFGLIYLGFKGNSFAYGYPIKNASKPTTR
ncbi:WD40/YVTN/BNR-like repeat-containing protein [Capsulimonas corticalis]|nr:sialidase family protein [Capsulimonas corticalis]